MAENEHKYPADEFDNPPIGPTGMHRGKRSLAVRLVPYIVTIVIALALGIFAWAFFSGAFNQRATTAADNAASTSAQATESSASASDTASSGTASSTDAASASSSAEESTSDSASPSDTESSSSASATANMAATVIVYNGSGVNGAAASTAQTLMSNGYTDVSAMNPSDYNSLPTAATVWYGTDADLATAQNIASTLGISNVVQVSGLSCDVAVVLR
ncbi:MAG: LytR C-terminal domain-containing protein [Pseudoscardovia radai]|nr:LytR C-terminal domain-containing protein [Pseudoscardovia radai]